MHPILFELGPLSLKSFGLMVAAALLTGIHLAKRSAAKEGIDPRTMESLCYWVIGMSFAGARLNYMLDVDPAYYSDYPFQFFALHKGGLHFPGGLIFAVATAATYCRVHRLSFWQMVDIMAPPLSLGLAIGKIGCLLAGCCHGGPCQLPWGLTFTNPAGLARPLNVPLHPTQLYESLAWTALFGLLLIARRYRRYYGDLFLFFVTLFCSGRVFFERFREGIPRHAWNMTTTQFISIFAVLAAVVAWWGIRRRDWSRQVPA